MSSSEPRRFTIALVTLALCTMSQCVCQNRNGDKPSGQGGGAVAVDPGSKSEDDVGKAANKPSDAGDKPVELPQKVDAKDLDGAEKKMLAAIMGEQFDPCGSPKSLMDVLKTASPCDRAVASGAKLVALIAKGLSKRQVVQEYLKELQRTSSKAEFSLEGSPVFGEPNAKITIVKFTDFQCPYCKMASQPLKDLAKKYNAKLVLKHMPLTHHTYAKKAALMSLAAHKQGKFWEVYKAFFANQDRLDDAVLRELVKAAGVDMKRFDEDLKSPELPALLERDRKEADEAKVDGTPTIFVNGYQVEFDNLEDKLRELQ